jgi:hypothetical protein
LFHYISGCRGRQGAAQQLIQARALDELRDEKPFFVIRTAFDIANNVGMTRFA